MPKITISKQSAIHELYKKGYSIGLISETLHISKSTIKEYMRSYNMKMKIKKMHFENKMIASEVAGELGVSPATVRSYIKKIEIERLRKERNNNATK